MNAMAIEQLDLAEKSTSDSKPIMGKKVSKQSSVILSAVPKENTSPPLVMLRGLARGQYHWSSFKSQLQKAFPERDVLLIDLPGNGELSHLTSPNSIKSAADSISTQLELKGIKGPCDFIGLSLGGILVLYMMENTSWVRRGCVINASLGALSLPSDRMKPMAMLGLLYSRLLPTQQQEKLVWQLTASQPVDKAILKNWVNVANINKVSVNNIRRQLMIARSYNKKPILGKKADDLLILSSKKDSIVHSKCSMKLAKHTGAQHKEHKTAGHDLPLDDPQWVASCAYQFFR